MEGSYIKLFRKIAGWEWYDNPNMLALWIHLLVDANYRPAKWHGMDIEKGQLVTSISDLAKKTGLSVQQTRTCLSNMQKCNQVTIKSTNKYTIITICNYDSYQDCERTEQQTNNKQTTNKQQTEKEIPPIPPKESIEESKESKEYTPPIIPPNDGRVGYEFFGTFKNVELKPAELRKLQMDFGETETQSAIDDLSCKLLDGSTESHAHYATLTYWLANRRKKVKKQTAPESKAERNKSIEEETKRLLGL